MSTLASRLAIKGVTLDSSQAARSLDTKTILSMFNKEAWIYYHEHETDVVLKVGWGPVSIQRTFRDLKWLFNDLFGTELAG